MTEILGHPLENMLHKLWTKAVGTEGYDKKLWMELERLIHKEILKPDSATDSAPKEIFDD